MLKTQNEHLPNQISNQDNVGTAETGLGLGCLRCWGSIWDWLWRGEYTS